MKQLAFGKINKYTFSINCFEISRNLHTLQTVLWFLHKCIKPMTGYLFINNIWPEFAELLAKRPITIHEFNSIGMDCLNNTFFGGYFKFIMLCHKSTLYSCLKIFSTFNPSPCTMYIVALFMFVLIWPSQLLLTIALAVLVCPADSGEKSKLIFKKSQTILYWWWLLRVE